MGDRRGAYMVLVGKRERKTPLEKPRHRRKHIKIEKLSKDALVHTTKAHKGSRGIALLIFNLGAKWRWVVNSSSSCFTPGKEPQYTLHRRLWAPEPVRTFLRCPCQDNRFFCILEWILRK
jgi:hypothetical protein